MKIYNQETRLSTEKNNHHLICTNYYNKNFCIIDFILLYIIINIYMNKTKNLNWKKSFQLLKFNFKY